MLLEVHSSRPRREVPMLQVHSSRPLALNDKEVCHHRRLPCR